jgi:uncharacterized membrane protein
MDDFTWAKVLHVVALVPWVGGVAFVTLVLMPAIRRDCAPDLRLAAFHRFERGFAGQARLWVALAGASGLWMIYRADIWSRFLDLRYWWMHAMLLIWAIFALMLFVIEPLALHARMARSATPQQDYARLERMHRILLVGLTVTLAGAMAGAHGLI